MILEYSIPGRAGMGLGMGLNLLGMAIYNLYEFSVHKADVAKLHAHQHLLLHPETHQILTHSISGHSHVPVWLYSTVAIVANIVTGFGCMNYAKAKNQNPLLGILGAIPPFGMIGLAIVCILPDKSGVK